MIDKHMDREVYYENNNVLDMKDYRRMINSIQNTPENKLRLNSNTRCHFVSPDAVL